MTATFSQAAKVAQFLKGLAGRFNILTPRDAESAC
jgi:hypothetical protein